ncbi:hypothetical protein F1188_09090 [Roseospira marina]|uniref:Class I SAM-dependent methyltransferase n=2 Tax=Roseospira marina TaxID=140057 RepID=A0A5M6IC90_9PROT|nr:hypothetical protein F1188_09090 [Roseospira marina]
MEAALTRRQERLRAAMVSALGATNDRMGETDGRVGALERESDTLTDTLADLTDRITKTLATLRADLTREAETRERTTRLEERQRYTAALSTLRAQVDATRTALDRSGVIDAARFRPFSRTVTDTDLDHLRDTWLPALGLPDRPPRALGYLADRLLALEDRAGGRLACTLPAAILRALAARAAPGGPDLRALEVGVLFGLGLAVLAEGVADQGRRARLLGLDPLDGGSYGAPDDPITGAAVTPARVRATLARCGVPRRAVTLVRRPSEHPLALARARRWAGREGLGLLVLDGRHDRAGLTEDWHAYAPLLRPGGLALIDDAGAPAWPDVAPFVWEEAAATPGFRLLGTDWHTAVLRRETGA